MRGTSLKATEYFEAVARLGSVTRAAAELGVTPSAVSQQLRLLEGQLGVRLFRREKRRLSLTLDGDRLYGTATQAFGAIRNAQGAIARQRDRRTLVLRVSPSFGVRWLGPRIADFAAENPDWSIRIDATPDFTAFETEAVDLDIRYGHGDWPGLAVEPLANDLVLPLCSPAYAARLAEAAPDLPGRIAAARLIDSAKSLYRWDDWLAANGVALPEPGYPFRFDRSSMAIEMARQGGGLALDSALLCLPELARGDLVPFDAGGPVADFPGYWLACPPRHLNRRIVARFGTWLRERATAHEADVRACLAGLGVAGAA